MVVPMCNVTICSIWYVVCGHSTAWAAREPRGATSSCIALLALPLLSLVLSFRLASLIDSPAESCTTLKRVPESFHYDRGLSMSDYFTEPAHDSPRSISGLWEADEVGHIHCCDSGTTV